MTAWHWSWLAIDYDDIDDFDDNDDNDGDLEDDETMTMMTTSMTVMSTMTARMIIQLNNACVEMSRIVCVSNDIYKRVVVN